MQIWSSPRRRASAFVAILVVLLVGALTAPSSAMASACGDRILEDWSDNGRIDRVYPLNCYDEAIDAIPADLRDYANVEDVITRAMDDAANGGSGDTREIAGLPSVDTSDPSAVPIPLLLLAAMAVLLLGAGGLGYLSRRRNGVAVEDAVDDSPDEQTRV